MLGARGAGKSFLSALNTHLTSRWYPGHGTRILGGSRAQSLQIYEALVQLARDSNGLLGADADVIERLTKHEANYRTVHGCRFWRLRARACVGRTFRV